MQQLAFIAFRGRDYEGDIALDNILVTDGSCPEQPNLQTQQQHQPSQSPLPIATSPLQNVTMPWSCGFEAPGICEMAQSASDQFDWTVANETLSTPTGPDAASSGDYFAYIEATGRGTNDTAL